GDYAAGGEDGVDWTLDQLGRERGQPVVLKVRPAIVDQEILLLNKACLVEAPADCGGRGLVIGLCRAAEKSQDRHPRLLRTRGERPRSRSAAEQRDERAPFHCPVLPCFGPEG